MSHADPTTLVQKSAEAFSLLNQAGRLIGESIRVPGCERVILASAVRSKVGEQLDERQVYALVDFIPLACAQVALANSGVRLPDHFGRKDSRGVIRQYQRLDGEPIYREAFALAQEWWPTRPDDVQEIAEWSGIPGLIQSAVAQGSKLSDLELVPPLLDGPDESCPPHSERPEFPDNPWFLRHWRPKPWWKFW